MRDAFVGTDTGPSSSHACAPPQQPGPPTAAPGTSRAQAGTPQTPACPAGVDRDHWETLLRGRNILYLSVRLLSVFSGVPPSSSAKPGIMDPSADLEPRTAQCVFPMSNHLIRFLKDLPPIPLCPRQAAEAQQHAPEIAAAFDSHAEQACLMRYLPKV